MKKIITAALLLMAFATQASAAVDVLGVCAGFKGYGHDVNAGSHKRQFYEDGFSQKSILLLQVIRDGKTSYKTAEMVNGETVVDENATYLLSQNPANGTLIIFVDGSAQSYTETYLFKFHQSTGEKGSVVYTQTRNGGSPSVRIMHGECQTS